MPVGFPIATARTAAHNAMTEFPMDPDEYFLLTAAHEYGVPIHFLADPDRGHGMNLHDPPDLFGEKLVQTLIRLFERGDIAAQQVRWYRDQAGRACRDYIGGPFVPSRKQIEQALAYEILLYYQLTAQGGARWEAAAEADWDKYVLSLDSVDPAIWEYTATTREAVKRDMNRFLSSDPFPDEDRVPIPETGRWEVLEPWEITYWKILPIGHRMTCAVQTVKLSQPKSFEDVKDRIKLWTKDRQLWSSDSRFRKPEPAEPPHPFIDRFRRPWRLFPRPGDTERATHWHFRLSYRRIEFTHHVYWDFDDEVLRSEIYRYDAPDFVPTRILAPDEKPLPHWEAVFELRDHLVRKSVDRSDQ